MRRVLCAGFVLLCGSACSAEPALPDAVRRVLEQGTQVGVWPAVAVGMVRDGASASWFFGHLDGEGSAAPDAKSRFELGPASEIYTGLFLAQEAVAGRLRLDDALSAHRPDDVEIADKALAGASLRDWALHRVPLPALPPNLFPRRDADPFATYDRAALLSLLADCACSGEGSGEDGPLAYGVLGAVLAPGDEFAARLRERVLEPLELVDTGVGDTGLVTGHALGEAVETWHYGALAPAAGLRSTLADQLHLLQAVLKPGDHVLRAALLLSRQPHDERAALGWHVAMVQADGQAVPVLWNGGSSGGHASFVGLRVDRQQGVALLGNAATDLTAVGLALLADVEPPPPAALLRRASAEEGQRHAGLYRVGPREEWVLRAGEDGLTLQRPGQFPQPLLHYDEDAFQLGGVNAQLTFQRNAAGNLEGALLHQGGLNLAVERLSDRAPVLARTPVSAKPEDLDACAGDYALSPLVQIRLSHNGDGLRWQLSGGAPAPLIAYAPDRYAAARGEFDLRCVREGGAAATVVVLSLAGTDVTARRVDWSLSAVGGKGKVADDKRPPSRSH